MALQRGFRLDHYEIIEMIGKGGMGEVYSANDTRLPRSVAVKTSKQQFSERFAREAKVIASLNHPNICTLFDVGPNYLVMEMIDGPTLAARGRTAMFGKMGTGSNFGQLQLQEKMRSAGSKFVPVPDFSAGQSFTPGC